MPTLDSPAPKGPALADPVTAEVVRSAMETVCFEMATYVSRTATTPILNQSNERNATVLDGTGRLAALSVGVPQFMLTSTLPVRFALDFFGDELAPGDVIVANDPYHGGGHLPDFNVFAPVFVGGELVLIASMQCHHGDTGGAVAGGYNNHAADIWSEGIRYPAVKVFDAGRERRDVIHMMRVNNRLPGFIGDLRAQVGATRLGVERLSELVARYGIDTVRASVECNIADTARRVREEIASWPDGTYEADAWVDNDPAGHTDIRVHVRLTIAGDHATVDFTGSDTRDELQTWSTFGNTRGYVIAQLASLVDPTIPKNEGFFYAITLVVPEGSCVNPRPGKPVSAGTHHPGVEVGDAVALALSQIIPDRCTPQTYKMGAPRQMWGEHNPRSGKPFFDHGGELYAGWCGAVRGVDGWGAQNASFGNLIKATAEINETIFPYLLRGREYITDGGGAGRWRGLPGSRLVKQVLAPTRVSQYMVNRRHVHPGINGGRSGTGDRCYLKVGGPPDAVIDVQVACQGELLEPGECLVYEFGGGGGWGDPLQRDPAAVLDDVWDELVSLEGAARDYGVVITGSVDAMDLEIDEDATRRRRAEMRSGQ
ncbi:MAG: hydantoinase B/oxoprolinase family protein [Actinobacteria bacterium]|nr:hydantoinase B/oxoprolinase family protein [Actinomycetota bacterium]